MAPTHDIDLLAGLTGLDAAALQDRLDHRHRARIARIEGDLVAYGWIATDQAVIPHLGLTLVFRPGDRYLWDFVTSPPWRGKGIYPRLLQAIVRSDAPADRFWLGHDHSNEASRQGIARAGILYIGTLYRLPDIGYRFVPSEHQKRAAAAAALLGVPLADPIEP
jgi:GNAT superfamily N-acetyltransferase